MLSSVVGGTDSHLLFKYSAEIESITVTDSRGYLGNTALLAADKKLTGKP